MGKRSNWFERQRQAWIAETLQIYGFVNRRHLRRKFGISSEQARLDLRAFREANPGAIRYCRTARTWLADGPTTPAKRAPSDIRALRHNVHLDRPLGRPVVLD